MPTSPSARMYSDFIEELLMHLPFKESFYHLFNFLGKQIPLDRAVVALIHRNEKTLSSIIDYTSSQQQFISPHANTTHTLFSFERLKSLYNKDTKFVLINNDVEKSPGDSDFLFLNFQSHYNSYLSMALDLDENKNTIFTFNILSYEKNVYTQELADILALFREPLRKAMHQFFLSTDAPCLVLSKEGPVRASPEELLRRCKGLRKVMSMVDAVADKDTSVLVVGQSGSGKELVAETIHALSAQAAGPFVAVNCGAIPESLLDSELFGHEKGAFTGAHATAQGYFEQAMNGTIYLDEIGELSPQAQARLLRVLETNEVRRVGGNRRISVNARVIAATNRDLAAMAKEGRFRLDLWYRLNVFPIALPSLEQRADDIPVLVEYFYQYFVRHHRLTNPPALSSKLMIELVTRPWPGNVRELRSVLERALLICAKANMPLLELATQDRMLSTPRREQNAKRRGRPGLDDGLREATRTALAECGGRISGPDGAAARLGVSPNTVHNRLKNKI